MPGAFLVLLFTVKVGEELRNIVSLRRQKIKALRRCFVYNKGRKI